MNTKKVIRKLDKFFGLSAKKQQKKYDKLLKIISKLKQKKLALETEVVRESKIDDTSVRYQDLSQELKVVSRLIVKAKKHNLPGQDSAEQDLDEQNSTG